MVSCKRRPELRKQVAVQICKHDLRKHALTFSRCDPGLRKQVRVSGALKGVLEVSGGVLSRRAGVLGISWQHLGRVLKA